jgi:presenilin-like A22 family membrane protease
VRRTLAILGFVFLLTQLATMGIVVLITVRGEGPDGPREPKVDYIEGGETVESSLQIYLFMMAGVALVAVAMRLGLGKFLFRNLEALIVFLTTFLLLFSMYPSLPHLWVLPALLGVLIRRVVRHWAFVTALSIYLASIVGAILGVSLGVVPIIALTAFLSVYDIVAVKFSGHMGNVVRHVKGTGSAFLVEIPALKAAVGISDLAVPSMFVGANFLAGSYFSAIAVALGGLLGLGLAIGWSNKSGMVPALPFVFSGTMVGYLVSLLA